MSGINKMERLGDGKYLTQYVDICRHCKGLGKVENMDPDEETLIGCPVCEGTGRVFVRKEIRVTVEPYK